MIKNKNGLANCSPKKTASLVPSNSQKSIFNCIDNYLYCPISIHFMSSHFFGLLLLDKILVKFNRRMRETFCSERKKIASFYVVLRHRAQGRNRKGESFYLQLLSSGASGCLFDSLRGTDKQRRAKDRC